MDHTTTRHAIQFRVYSGPPWRRSDAADFYDWSALNYGASGDVAPGETTLSATLASGATSANIASYASWPTKGGCWIGPNGVGETWEYVTFTGRTNGTLSGLTRETADAEQTGTHTTGAAVRFWWPITTDDGRLRITEELDSRLSVVDWRGELAGFSFPRAALRNGHLCLIQVRSAEAVAGAWSSWTNAWLGWLKSPSARDSAEREGKWKAQVISGGGVLADIKALGVRIGPLNVAKRGEALASGTLAAAYKELGAGEFTAASPNLSGASALDDDLNTLWISERMVGTANVPTDHCVDQIHIAAYVGQAAGYRWLQFPAATTAQVGWSIRLVNMAGYWPGGENGLGWNEQHPFEVGHGQPVIVCENATRFREENPDLGECEILEVSATSGHTFNHWNAEGYWEEVPGYTAAQWWDNFSPAGGALLVTERAGGTSLGSTGQVLWGTATLAGCAWTAENKLWTGAALAALAPGYTIRRVWANGAFAASGWSAGRASTPGYWLDGTRLEWLLATVQGLGLRLRDTITNAAPGAGATLYVTSDGGDTVDGLPASGTVQVGLEQISYSAKTAGNDGLVVSARGASGTTAAAHGAGDVVQVVDGGVATEAPLVNQVVIKRNGKSALKNFAVWASKLAHPRTPNDDGYENDYTVLATVTNNSGDYTLNIAPAARWRTFLIECSQMATNPYRMMLNELVVRGDTSVYAGSTTLGASSVATVAGTLLSNAGFPAGAHTAGAGTPTIQGVTTAPDMTAGVIADLAEMTGCRWTIQRDSKSYIAVDPFFGVSGLPAEALAWSRVTAGAFEPDFQSGRRVGQLEMTWQTLDSSTTGTVRYPAVRDALGDVARVGPYLYVDEAAALVGVRKRYWQMRRPFGGTVEAAGAPIAERAGACHGIEWTFENQGGTVDRTYLCDMAGHQVENGALTTVFHEAQISREDEKE